MPTKCSSFEDAHTILQGDFLSPELIQLKLGVKYSGDQIALLEKELPNEYKLRQSRDQGVMLVAGPSKPLTVAEICELAPDCFGHDTARWMIRRGDFGTATVNPGWMLFRKEPVPGSENKLWCEMAALVTEPRIIPNLAEAAWAIVAYKAAHGEFLFPEDYVCTSTSRVLGRHTMIGNCDSQDRIVVLEKKDGEISRWMKITQAQKKFSR
jgi:hypothetical protein